MHDQHQHDGVAQIRHFQSPSLQQVTLRHNVPERLSHIEKEQEYEQYWSSRISKIMQRIQAQSIPNNSSSGMQQQSSPAGMQPEHMHNPHRQHGASPYAQISPTYQHQYDNTGRTTTTSSHASTYAHHNAGRFGAMGAQGYQMQGHGDAAGFYTSTVYPSSHQSNMTDMMQQQQQQQQQHMQSQGGYRMNDSQYQNGVYQNGAMRTAAHGQPDARQRHNAAMVSSQQQRMSVGGATDSQYANMRHPQSQTHAGSYAMQSADPSHHANYSTTASGGDMTASGSKRMSSMMPAYSTAPRQGMQPHMVDTNMPNQMRMNHSPHVQQQQQHQQQHPSQSGMMTQSAPSGPGAGGMGTQGRGSTAGNPARSARESFADGIPNLEPTPIDQIGLGGDDDDFSDVIDMLGGQSPGGPEPGQDMPSGPGQDQNGTPFSMDAQLAPGAPSNGQQQQMQVSPQPMHAGMEMMPQGMASPHSSPAVMPHHQQQPSHMQMQQSPGGVHGMGPRTNGQQPGSQGQWMDPQTQPHLYNMQHMRVQHGHQGYPQGQPGYGQAHTQQGYAKPMHMHAQDQQSQHPHAMSRGEDHLRGMPMQQQPMDNAQVGKKQPRAPSTLPEQQQSKVAKVQQDSVPQAGVQQQQQQPGSSMAVAKDAHCEYRKAGDQVQAAHQLLRMVTGQAPQSNLSQQAIAHLSQAKWVEAVKKAIGDYQTTERTLHRAVKVLKTHQDRASQEQATQQLHKVATHARALQETLRQHIASAEAARVRFSAGGATQDPTTGNPLTPRSSNSVPPQYDASNGQKRALASRQHTGANGSLSAQYQADGTGGGGPAANGGYSQGPTTGTVAPAPAPTQAPKAKLRIRARGASAAAAQAQAAAAAAAASASAAEANAAATAAPNSEPGMMAAPSAAQPGFQGGPTSGAPSPRTTTPMQHMPSPAAGGTMPVQPSNQPALSAVSTSHPGETKPTHMHMYGTGNQMQHSQHMMHGSAPGAYGAPQSIGSPETAPSGLSSGTPHTHRVMDGSIQGMGQYGAGQYGAGGPMHASLAAGGPGGNNAPGSMNNNGLGLPQRPLSSAPGNDADVAANGGVTAPAAPMYVVPQGGVGKAQYGPETDYSSSGNLLRLSMVPDGAQKAMLTTTLNPVTHPVPPTSGIQSNSFDSDSTEVLSGPLRTPAPTTLSVCDLDLSVNDRYSTFSRAVDPATPMMHLPGKAACAASDASARPPAPPMTLPLPHDTESAHRLVSMCSALAADFPVSLQAARCNPVYSQQDAYSVAVQPRAPSNDGSHNGRGLADDPSWCSIEIILDEKAWDAGQQSCMIVWPQVHNTQRTSQAHAAELEMAASELRSLMQGLMADNGRPPSLQSIVDAWCKVHSHISQKLNSKLQQY